MYPRYLIITTVLTIASIGLSAESKPTVEIRSESGSESEMVCLKEGRWKVQNLEGWMDCTGPVNFKRKLKEVKDKGTIWILEEDCSRLFGEASGRNDEDVLMKRVESNLFQGTINGEEDGITMVIEVTWELHGDELIKGEMHSNPSLQGMMCEYYRPFTITWDSPIPAKDYEKLKKKMEKKLEKVLAKE
jgi:hypothetical protein